MFDSPTKTIMVASALPEITFIIQNTIVFFCFEVLGYVNVNPLDLVYINKIWTLHIYDFVHLHHKALVLGATVWSEGIHVLAP